MNDWIKNSDTLSYLYELENIVYNSNILTSQKIVNKLKYLLGSFYEMFSGTDGFLRNVPITYLSEFYDYEQLNQADRKDLHKIYSYVNTYFNNIQDTMMRYSLTPNSKVLKLTVEDIKALIDETKQFMKFFDVFVKETLEQLMPLTVYG